MPSFSAHCTFTMFPVPLQKNNQTQVSPDSHKHVIFWKSFSYKAAPNAHVLESAVPGDVTLFDSAAQPEGHALLWLPSSPERHTPSAECDACFPASRLSLPIPDKHKVIKMGGRSQQQLLLKHITFYLSFLLLCVIFFLFSSIFPDVCTFMLIFPPSCLFFFL